MNRNQKKHKYGGYEYSENELYEDEEDRQRISEMNELDRERLLDERVKKLVERKEREDALMKQKSEQNKKKDALQYIKKKRSQRKDREANKDEYDISSDSFSNDSESGEIDGDEFSSDDEDYSRSGKNKKRKRSYSSSSVISIDSESKKKESCLTLNLVDNAKVTRNFLEKFWDYPNFDTNVKGCFVRINYAAKNSNSNGYLLAQIKEIVDNHFQLDCHRNRIQSMDGQNGEIQRHST
jgi:hypothetical protein